MAEKMLSEKFIGVANLFLLKIMEILVEWLAINNDLSM
jgi:hypothetical protein